MTTPNKKLQKILDDVNIEASKREAHKCYTNAYFHGPDNMTYVLTTTGNFVIDSNKHGYKEIMDYIESHVDKESQYTVLKKEGEIESVHHPKIDLGLQTNQIPELLSQAYSKRTAQPKGKLGQHLYIPKDPKNL